MSFLLVYLTLGLSLRSIRDKTRDPAFAEKIEMLKKPMRIMALALQVYTALEMLHEMGYTHQDIKRKSCHILSQ